MIDHFNKHSYRDVLPCLYLRDRHRCHLTNTPTRALMEEPIIKTIDNIRVLHKKFKLQKTKSKSPQI